MARPNKIRVGLLQLNVTNNKEENVENALINIRKIYEEKQPRVIVLPECFNCPYGTEYFSDFAELIPDGYTSQKLSEIAKELNVYIIGGSIIEKDEEDKLYNTSTVWSPNGELIGKHRKVHLFDVDIKDMVTFTESSILTPGKDFTIVDIDNCKFGILICNDIRFEEFSRIYRNEGCDVLIIPSAFDVTTGPIYWTLLQQARAADNQLYVSMISTARDENFSYQAYGHTMCVDPWANILCEASEKEELLCVDLDLSKLDEIREQIPLFQQRRTDLYDTVN